MLNLHSLMPSPARSGLTLVALVAASVSLSACTTSGSGSTAKLDGEAGLVQETLDTFSDRADDDDAKGICRDLLTAEAQQAIAKGGDCAAAVQKVIDRTDLLGLDVDTVKVTGTTAVATIVKTKRATNQTKIVLQQDAPKKPWKIAAFGNEAAAGVAQGVGDTTPSTPATTPKSTPAS